MDRQKVKSSQIDSVAYDPATEILEVEFKTGGVYQYEKVPASAYAELIAAESIGSHFHKNVRGIYGYAKTESREESLVRRGDSLWAAGFGGAEITEEMRVAVKKLGLEREWA